MPRNNNSAQTTVETPKKVKSESVKIEKYDPNAIKLLFDEALVKSILQAGYQEDVKISNKKIFLGLIICLIAATAHFFPVPWPEVKPVVLACCISYYILSAALQYILIFQERNIILFTIETPKKKALEIGSDMERFDDKYYFTIGFNKTKTVEKFKVKITEFLDEDGYFYYNLFNNFVIKSLNNFTKQN
eukprot:TRINITY_DN984_c0_g2_i1.p1 TRINITY_DN984_c0_g2~~TRINITY_DN984_c0_g2_i1.p1  ORF type:complete len:189 (-),score=65.41 TRINITY_DN984_c0_g2_i1:110-676(-)